jgi:hypothetical protein
MIIWRLILAAVKKHCPAVACEGCGYPCCSRDVWRCIQLRLYCSGKIPSARGGQMTENYAEQYGVNQQCSLRQVQYYTI